jgi:hypothetical protein
MALAVLCVLQASALALQCSTPARRCAAPVLLAPPVEFSRTISVTGLRKQATRNSLCATPEECAALAARFELMSLGSLEANVSLAVVDPRRSRVRAYGSLRASDVAQQGAPVVQIDEARFETFFIDEDLLSLGSGGAYDSESDDSYDEPIEDGQIDMGELVAQHLYLWLAERAMDETRAASGEFAAGTVVIDTGSEGSAISFE